MSGAYWASWIDMQQHHMPAKWGAQAGTGHIRSANEMPVQSKSTIGLQSNSHSMLCLRCGGCCLHLDIYVVNTASILPDGSINPDDSESMIFKPSGIACPHLSFQIVSRDDHRNCAIDGDAKVATCTIHHLSCYQGTPCHQFEQVGPEDDVCIMSGYFRMMDCKAASENAQK